jgi:B12-binding domain/radical SAM domain protein
LNGCSTASDEVGLDSPTMKRFRFTFIFDRQNRTATAALLAALEDVVEDPEKTLRVVRTGKAAGLDFAPPDVFTEIVCMSSMTAGFPHVASTLKRLRARWGKHFVAICGGSHATADPAGTLAAGFDYCCAGEGEEVVRALAGRVAAGEALETIPGLYHLEAGHLAGSRRRKAVDVTAYRPLPGRVRFPTYIEIGRGCRWACTYCQTPAVHGSVERFRDADMIEAAVSAYAGFGMKDFRFMLPNALGYAARDRSPNCEALDEILRRARSAAAGGRLFLGSFPSEVRPDYVTDEAIRVLGTYVSNRQIVIGGQSGSQRMLDLIRRGHTVEDIRRACRVVVSHGFVAAVDFILGLPGETEDDRRATLGLVTELAGEGAVANMHFFTPLPGTALAGSDPVYLTDGERTELDRLGQQGIVRGRWRRQEEWTRRWAGSRQDRNPIP